MFPMDTRGLVLVTVGEIALLLTGFSVTELAVTLHLGPDSSSLAIGWAGTVAALLGLAKAGHGFATSSIEFVAGALTFMLCACFVSLVVMAVVGFPLYDRAAPGPGVDKRWRRATRLVWWGLPLVGFLALVLATVLVMVPMTAQAR
ncbi:MAG TPA: hypothetical protein VLH75_01010 [Longimicrobiales bacterium]|nr:hypothetical protein [Longimicrobiales bacterium]